MEVVPTADGILGARAASGNGTSSKVSRADAQTYRLTEFDVLLDGYQEALQDGPLKERVAARLALRNAFLLALQSAPVEQHEAAPADERTACIAWANANGFTKYHESMCAAWEERARRVVAAQPEPPVADERAAIDAVDAMLKANAVFFGREKLRQIVEAARASSPNAVGAGDATVAWMHVDDPRDCVSDAKKRDMIEHAGAPGARLAANYSIALGKIGPAQAVEPVASPAGYALVPIERSYEMRAKALIAFNTTEHAGKDRDDALDAAAAPPAPASAPVGLNEGQWYDLASRHANADWNSDGYLTAVKAVCSDYRALLATQQPEPRASTGVIAAAIAVIGADRAQTLTTEHINSLDNAIKIQRGELALPEPRDEVTDDWISVAVQRPCDAGIVSCDDVLAWNSDPGFPTIVEAHFVSPGFPEYTHWKRKPDGPVCAAHAGDPS
ncbi:hypothetical protein CFB39_10210 [Burkholderia sp. AU6039]|nr:hypothetical protein CFB39_10210 [Burkholderia sp. AU6039]